MSNQEQMDVKRYAVDQALLFISAGFPQASITTLLPMLREAYSLGVSQERERCAKICDECGDSGTPTGYRLADAIRKGE